MADYTLEGPKWGGKALGTAGGTITWAVDGTIPAAFLPDISTAFAAWASYANITFQQVAATAGANITFTETPIDGVSDVLANTNYRYSGGTFSSAAVTFDSGEGWHGTGTGVVSQDGAKLALVAAHEIGHAIGLGHYDAAPAVMNATLNPAVTGPTRSDIDGAEALYGAAAASAVVAFQDGTSGQGGSRAMDAAGSAGPDYLSWQYIYAGSDSLALSTQAANVFIHAGSGTDAIQVSSGRNVLDGGTGSNFLTGGSGTDTFFTDARDAGVVWNTLRNFHAGDAATLWGFAAGVSSYHWDAAVAGAAGSEGATLRANIVGGAGRTGDGIDASITFAGMTVDQAKGLQIVTGTQPAGSYLYVYNPGV